MSAAYPNAEMVTAEMENSAAAKTTSVAAAESIVITPVAVTSVPEQTTLTSSTAVRHQSAEVLGERQGQKCCGCCCDYRRAVIIINIIIGILEAILLILVASRMYNSVSVTGDDSEIAGKYQTIEMIFSGISILLSALAIAGAYTYNIILVSLNVLWLVAAFVLGIFFSLEYCNDYCDTFDDDFITCTCNVSVLTWITSGVVMCLFVYPHVGFIIEVRKGIMSRETYRREEFSCCCT